MEIVLIVLVVAARRAARIRRRCARRARARATRPLEAERAELEAAKEAKYREIRDAELDHRTGKLSEADWRALDRHAARRGDGDAASGWTALERAEPLP